MAEMVKADLCGDDADGLIRLAQPFGGLGQPILREIPIGRGAQNGLEAAKTFGLADAGAGGCAGVLRGAAGDVRRDGGADRVVGPQLPHGGAAAGRQCDGGRAAPV